MLGYVFEVINKQTGNKYYGKKYAVSFDKKYFGDNAELAKEIEKYGEDAFEVKMILPFEDKAAIDACLAEIDVPQKKVAKVEPKVEEPKVEEPKEEPVKKAKTPAKRGRKKAE